MVSDPFGYTNYVIRKQFWKLFGGKFRVYTPQGDLALFANMKAFKLREDIRLYSGEDMLNEILHIKARSIIDWSAAYDVFASATQEKIGTLKRKGFKSLLKDEWVVMDSVDNEIGYIREDRMILALLRRFVTNLIPQIFRGQVRGMPAFKFSQHFNPFLLKVDLDFSEDTQGFRIANPAPSARAYGTLLAELLVEGAERGRRLRQVTGVGCKERKMFRGLGYSLVFVIAAAALMLVMPVVHAVVVYREWIWQGGLS